MSRRGHGNRKGHFNGLRAGKRSKYKKHPKVIFFTNGKIAEEKMTPSTHLITDAKMDDFYQQKTTMQEIEDLLVATEKLGQISSEQGEVEILNARSQMYNHWIALGIKYFMLFEASRSPDYYQCLVKCYQQAMELDRPLAQNEIHKFTLYLIFKGRFRYNLFQQTVNNRGYFITTALIYFTIAEKLLDIAYMPVSALEVDPACLNIPAEIKHLYSALITNIGLCSIDFDKLLGKEIDYKRLLNHFQTAYSFDVYNPYAIRCVAMVFRKLNQESDAVMCDNLINDIPSSRADDTKVYDAVTVSTPKGEVVAIPRSDIFVAQRRIRFPIVDSSDSDVLVDQIHNP